MKSHELAENLEKLAKTLKTLPNTELSEIIELIFSLTPPKEKQTKREKLETTHATAELESTLSKMPAQKIEDYLESQCDDFPTKRLLELASRIGLTTSKRQSRSALVNLISRHYESGQLDMLLRNSRHKPAPEAKEQDSSSTEDRRPASEFQNSATDKNKEK
jgi:hypothetical protein